jgi:outer membrane protein TolC
MASSLFANSLTLNQALETARANNDTLKIATLSLNQTLREGEENTLLPSISFDVGLTTKASIADSSISTTYSVGSLSFKLSSANKYEKQQMALSSTVGLNTYKSTLNTVESKVSTAYWNLSAAQVSAKDSQLNVEKEQRYLENVEAKYEAGLDTTLKVNQAKLALYDAQFALQTSLQNVEKATDSLNQAMGTEGTWELAELPSVQTLLPLENLYSLVANTSSAQALAYKVEQAKLNLKSEKNSSLSPTVSFSASTGLSGSISSTDITFKDSTQVGVSVSVPLDSYLKNSSSQISLDSKAYGVEIAQASYEKGISELKAAVKTSYTSLQQAKANLEKLTQHQKLAQEQLSLLQKSYDAGQSSFNDLEDGTEAVRTSEFAIIRENLVYTLSFYNLLYLLEVEPNVLVLTK